MKTILKTVIETDHACMILEDGVITQCSMDDIHRAGDSVSYSKTGGFQCNSRNTAEFVCRLGINEMGRDFARAASQHGITLDSVRRQLLIDMNNAIYEYVGGEFRWDISDQTPDQELNFEYESNSELRSRVDMQEFVKEFEKQYKHGTYDEFIKSEKGVDISAWFKRMFKKTKTWEELFDQIDTDTCPGGYCSSEFFEWVDIRISSAIQDTNKVIMQLPVRRNKQK